MYKRGFKTWAERTAMNIRRRAGCKIADPLDLYELARRRGITVWVPEDFKKLPAATIKILLMDDPESWSALTLRMEDKTGIILNSAHNKARQASDLAHELAHLIIGHTCAKTYMTPNGLLLATHNREEEDEAAWLSGCLLLPREVCVYIKKQKISDESAMKRYGVSKQMLTYRLNVTGVAKDAQLHS
jgi:Zn-dependent peptidase ImmA (M78 family)